MCFFFKPKNQVTKPEISNPIKVVTFKDKEPDSSYETVSDSDIDDEPKWHKDSPRLGN